MKALAAGNIFQKVNMRPVDIFAVLSHETRLRCLLLLLDQAELCVCDLTAVIGAPQPSVSRHLGQLRTVGLVTDRRQGQWIYYRLADGLPAWVMTILRATAQSVAGASPFDGDRQATTALLMRDVGRRCR